MIGTTIENYHILEKVGHGGMGVVYKAFDTTLQRTVALKFLPENFAASETDKARFLREVRAASAINHPNVCTIYDLKEHEGAQFIVMEYIEGHSDSVDVTTQRIISAFDVRTNERKTAYLLDTLTVDGRHGIPGRIQAIALSHNKAKIAMIVVGQKNYLILYDILKNKAEEVTEFNDVDCLFIITCKLF